MSKLPNKVFEAGGFESRINCVTPDLGRSQVSAHLPICQVLGFCNYTRRVSLVFWRFAFFLEVTAKRVRIKH